MKKRKNKTFKQKKKKKKICAHQDANRYPEV